MPAFIAANHTIFIQKKQHISLSCACKADVVSPVFPQNNLSPRLGSPAVAEVIMSYVVQGA